MPYPATPDEAPTRVAVQVRFEPELHAAVAQLAETLHLTRNAAYQMLVELGLQVMTRRPVVTREQIEVNPPDLVSVAKASMGVY